MGEDGYHGFGGVGDPNSLMSIHFTTGGTPKIYLIISLCSLTYYCKARVKFCNSTFLGIPEPLALVSFLNPPVVILHSIELGGLHVDMHPQM